MMPHLPILYFPASNLSLIFYNIIYTLSYTLISRSPLGPYLLGYIVIVANSPMVLAFCFSKISHSFLSCDKIAALLVCFDQPHHTTFEWHFILCNWDIPEKPIDGVITVLSCPLLCCAPKELNNIGFAVALEGRDTTHLPLPRLPQWHLLGLTRGLADSEELFAHSSL